MPWSGRGVGFNFFPSDNQLKCPRTQMRERQLAPTVVNFNSTMDACAKGASPQSLEADLIEERPPPRHRIFLRHATTLKEGRSQKDMLFFQTLRPRFGMTKFKFEKVQFVSSCHTTVQFSKLDWVYSLSAVSGPSKTDLGFALLRNTEEQALPALQWCRNGNDWNDMTIQIMTIMEFKLATCPGDTTPQFSKHRQM